MSRMRTPAAAKAAPGWVNAPASYGLYLVAARSRQVTRDGQTCWLRGDNRALVERAVMDVMEWTAQALSLLSAKMSVRAQSWRRRWRKIRQVVIRGGEGDRLRRARQR